MIFNVFFVPVYTMEQYPNKIIFMLKPGFGFPNIILEPSLLLMLPLCDNDFQWIMNYTSELVMSLMYLFYGTQCVVQRAPCYIVCMDLSIMEICCTFAQMFELSDLMCYLKEFRLKSFYPWKTSMLKPLYLYMLVNVFNCLMILSELFDIQFFTVRKVILDGWVYAMFSASLDKWSGWSIYVVGYDIIFWIYRPVVDNSFSQVSLKFNISNQ